MWPTALLLICITLCACSPAPPPRPQEPPKAAAPSPAPSTISTPIDVIRPIYDGLIDPATATEPRGQLYSDSLQAAWDAFEAEDDMGLGFDPFINAQDGDVARVDLVIENPSTGRAVVRASFVNFGEPRNVRFDMVFEEGEWRIDNMRGDNPPYDLRQALTHAPD